MTTPELVAPAGHDTLSRFVGDDPLSWVRDASPGELLRRYEVREPVYLHERFYSPDSGRFTRLDPFGGASRAPLSLHKYAYVHGNPIMGTDPSGLVNWQAVGKVAVVALKVIIAVALAYAAYNVVSYGYRVVRNYFAFLGAKAPTNKEYQTIDQAGKDLGGLLSIPEAHDYYKNYYSEDSIAGQAERAFSVSVFESNANVYGAVAAKISLQNVYLEDNWFSLNRQQRAIALLHELRHASDGAGEKEAYRITWIGEVLYRAKANPGLRPLPLPPNDPPNFAFGEKFWVDSVANDYLSIEERTAIVEEFNRTGRINYDFPVFTGD